MEGCEESISSRQASSATVRLAQYIKEKGISISRVSRATGISYTCLYASLGEKGRNRPLSVDEALLVCEFLEVDPRDLADKKEVEMQDINTRVVEIEGRLARVEATIKQWQAPDPDRLNSELLKDILKRFQSRSGAIRDNAPESS